MHTNLKSVLARTFALALTFITGSALAATPVAVWDGDFDVVQKRGTNNDTFTLAVNGNIVAADGLSITIADTERKGVYVNWTTTISDCMVVMKYENLTAPSSTPTALIGMSTAANANVDGLSMHNSSGQLKAYWKDGYYYSGGDKNMAFGSGKIALRYSSSGTYARAINADGEWTDVYSSSSTKGNGTYVMNGAVVGGSRALSANGEHQVATGMKITGIAIFSGVALTDIDTYVWPSETVDETWNDFSYARGVYLRVGSGEIAANTATYYQMDVEELCIQRSFAGNGTNYDRALIPGATGTGDTLFWPTFCYGANAGTIYGTPGSVMVLSGGSGYAIDGTFSPLTLGGLYVAEGTTGYSFTGSGRTTIFGDASGTTNTLFRINETFAVTRSGRFAFVGDVDLEIARGKTLTIPMAEILGTCEQTPAGQTFGTSTAGGTLRLKGDGVLVSTSLAALDATLDYSAQALERLTGDTPFIDGTLAVDEGTTIILPADAQPSVAYKLATTISGDTIAALKLGEEDIPDGATIVLNELNGTVSYIEGKCEKDIEGAVDYSRISWSKTPTAIDLATLNAADGTELTFDTAAEFMQLDIIAAGDLTLNVNNALAHPVAVKLQEGVESATITLTKGGDGSLATPISVVAGCKVVVGAGATLADMGSCTVVLSATDSFTLTSVPLQTFVGEGSLVFDGVVPSAAQRTIFADSTLWTGTVWLKNVELTNNNFLMSNYGNADSKIKLTGITGFAPASSNPTAVDCVSEVELVDEGEILAVALNDGYSSSGGNTCTYTFAKITGAGTFKNSGGSCSPQYRFVDVADFTGTLWVASNMRFVIGEGTGFGDSQKITIDGNAEIACTLTGKVVNKAAVTLKGGKTLTIAAGDEGAVDVKNGTLRLTLTTAQAVSGYTADGVTLPQGQNIVFVKPDGTEIVGEGNAFGGDGVLWTGAAMDSLWSSPNNWSNQKTPTADTEVSIKQDAEIILTEGDACSNLVLNANVTLKGDVSSLGTTSVGEGCALTFNVANDAEMIVSNAINGAGAVIKSGEGTLTLTQTSDYTGGTTVEQGGLVFGPNDCPIGPYEQNATVWTTNAVVKSGAWLDLNGRLDQTYVIMLESEASLLNNGADIGMGKRQTKMVALSGNATVGGTGAFGIHNGENAASKLELGEYTLTKTGTNAFDLVNTTISGTGTIAIEEGSLRTYTTASTAANATLTFAEGTSANLGANLTVKNLVLNGAPINGAGVLTATGVIDGDQTLVKRGNGTLRLNAANTYTGGTVVEQGTLQLGNYQALGGGTKTVTVWRGGAVDTLDANGVNDAYSLIFADAGEGATAKLLKSTTGNQGVGKTYPIRYLSLEADGEIAVPNAASGFGLVGQGFTATTIALSTNTLAKTGAGQFILCNTTIGGTGVIDVRAGELAVLHGDTKAAEATLNLASGTTLNVGTDNNVGTLTVKNLTGSGTITGDGTVTVTGTMDASYASFENVVPESGSTMLISDSSGCPVEITNIPLSGTLFVDLTDEVVAALASSPIGTKVAKFSPVLANGIKLSDHAKQAFEALNLRLAKGTDADGSVIFATAKPTGFQLILR